MNHELAERVERLERLARRWRGAAIGLIMVGLAAIAAGAGPKTPKPAPQAVEASRFVLRDDKNRIRATVGMDGGTPGVVLYGEQGSPEASLYTTGDGGAAVTLYGANPGQRVVLTSQTSTSTLALGQRETGSATLTVPAGGAPLLQLYGKSGHVMIGIVPGQGGPGVEMTRDGKVIFHAP
jgi:hypothetical protein